MTDTPNQNPEEETISPGAEETANAQQDDDGVDHAERLMKEMDPIDKVVKVDPDHVKDFINLSTVFPVPGALYNPFQAWKGFTDGQSLLVTDKHPAVSKMASVRAATLFLAGQTYLNYVSSRTCISEEDFQSIFGGQPPEKEIDEDHQILLLQVAEFAAKQCWDKADNFPEAVCGYLDKVTLKHREKLLIPQEKEGHPFRAVEFLYVARGGQFNVIAGMLIHYGFKGNNDVDPDVVLLSPPDASLKERFEGLEHDAETELQIRIKESLIYVRDIVDFRNRQIDTYASDVMEEMYQQLLSHIGEDRLKKPEVPETEEGGEPANDSAE